ncbi:dGTP triphosphohydrolase [Pedobacter sp. BG31]|uniref:dGTP triphosphohydrolase n=1 Tax=Pedobacter sp. BG31 TaxID=3349697 RepID=UPI0035F4D6BD
MGNTWEILLDPKTFRVRSQTIDSDGRDPFESDYGRLISSSAVRRLQDKTQVFPLEKSDFIRTRLTHSMEVSSIGRSIGKSIEKYLFENNKLDQFKYSGHLSSLLSTIGLIHDIGNPPFGHFGESAIQSFFNTYFENSDNRNGWNDQEIADLTNFDGNVQTFRILRKLQFLVDEFSYNLTFPTLAGIIKYPKSSIDGNKGKTTDVSEKKFGYFVSETDDFLAIDSHLKLNGKRHPITFLLEAADDIAYSAADIEDGVKVGNLSFELIREVFEKHLNRHDPDEGRLLNDLEKFHTDYRNLPSDRLNLTVQRFRISAQGFMIGSIVKEFTENYDDIMDGNYKSELINRSKANNVRNAFKDLSYHVFKNRRIVETEIAGWEIIYGLLDVFITAAKSPKFKDSGNSKESRLFNLISSSYRHIYLNFNHYNRNEEYSKFQLVVDFISGMTDSYALALFQKLKGIKI